MTFNGAGEGEALDGTRTKFGLIEYYGPPNEQRSCGLNPSLASLAVHSLLGRFLKIAKSGGVNAHVSCIALEPSYWYPFFFFFKTIYIPVQPNKETLVDTHINGVSKSRVV